MSHSINSMPRQLTLFPTEKPCTKCGVIKPLDAFYKQRDRPLGRRSQCKECCAGSASRYNAMNLEANRLRMAEWRARNPERHTEYLIKYRSGTRFRNYHRSYRRKNREKYREYAARRRALKASTRVGKVDYAAILQRDGYVCHICGQEVEPSDVHFDHVIPLSKGGPHVNENIAVSHSSCNVRKNAKILPD